MNLWDILILVLIACPAAFLFLKGKKTGSSDCSSGCTGCPFAGSCGKAEHRDQNSGSRQQTGAGTQEIR